MHFTPTFLTLLTAFSLSTSLTPTLASEVYHSNRDDRTIRVPLERKWVISHPPPGPSPNEMSAETTRDLAARTDGAAKGYVNQQFLKAHVERVARKYRSTFAAYESNTGAPHPLAAVTATLGTPDTSLSLKRTHPTVREENFTWGPNPAVDGQSDMSKRMERRRRRDADSPSAAPGVSVPLGHDRQRSQLKRDATPLQDMDSNLWMGAISLGTPPKNFTVDFDTGSADLVLPGAACNTTCDGHTLYDPTQSSSSRDLGKTFTITYGDGSNVEGEQYADNVFVGGYEATNQTLGAASTYSDGFQISAFPPDGLLGLGFPAISLYNAQPVFQTLVSSGAVQEAVFGFTLSSAPGRSELMIGGTDTTMYQASTMTYVSLKLEAYWQIPLDGLTRPGMNGSADVVLVNQTSYAQAIIDTGTTLIVTSDSNAETFYANITGAKPNTDIGGGVWNVPCDTIGSIAPTLTFGGRAFTVSPSTFNLGPAANGSTDCVAGLAGGGGDYWIVGDVFLQNVYSVFDVGNSRIGFADLNA